jgi:hypothetical protein
MWRLKILLWHSRKSTLAVDNLEFHCFSQVQQQQTCFEVKEKAEVPPVLLFILW